MPPVSLETLKSSSALVAPSIDDGGQLVAGDTVYEPVIPDLGHGILSIDNDLRAYAIKSPDTTPEASEHVFYRLSLVETQEQLRKELGVSASGSYSGISLTAGGSAEYFEKTQLDAYSFCIVVRVLVTTHRKVIAGAADQLEQDIVQAATNGQFAGIGRKYGDQYINEVFYGGEYYAIAHVSARTATEYQQLKAAANIDVYGVASGGTDFSQKFSQLKIEKRVSATQILNGVIAPIPEWHKVDEFARNFPAKVKASGDTPVAYRVQEISQATNYPIAAAGFLFSEEQKQHFALRRVADKVSALRASWEKVHSSAGLFEGEPADTALEALEKIGELDAVKLDVANAMARLLLVDIGKSPLPTLPVFSLDPYSALPRRISTPDRPRIKVSWSEAGNLKGEQVGNTGIPADWNSDWFRSHGGKQTALTEIKAEFVDDHPAIELEMNCRWGIGGNNQDSGWQKASNGAFSPQPLTGLAFRLTGPASALYQLAYTTHHNNVGDALECGDSVLGAKHGAGTMSFHGGYPIQGVRLVVVLGN